MLVEDRSEVISYIFSYRFSTNECSDSIFSSGLFEPLDKSKGSQFGSKNTVGICKEPLWRIYHRYFSTLMNFVAKQNVYLNYKIKRTVCILWSQLASYTCTQVDKFVHSGRKARFAYKYLSFEED